MFWNLSLHIHSFWHWNHWTCKAWSSSSSWSPFGSWNPSCFQHLLDPEAHLGDRGTTPNCGWAPRANLSANWGSKIGSKNQSIDWFKGKNTGKSHISWENRWFPVDFPLSQPIESRLGISDRNYWRLDSAKWMNHLERILMGILWQFDGIAMDLMGHTLW